MTFVEYIARSNADNFNEIDNNDIEWAKEFVRALPYYMENNSHSGDCTKDPWPCTYCIIESSLRDYYLYIFYNIM